MQDDDHSRGRVLTRRELLGLIGASGAAFVARGAAASDPLARTLAALPRGDTPDEVCIARPIQTEGPYFVDEMLQRSDIRSDPSDASVRPGAALQLTFRVTNLDAGCTPLVGAHVDLWHCDAAGVYSDVQDPRFDTTGKKFLRGYQITDTGGAAQFITIYPGWYQGRTVHMHFKIRSAPNTSPGFEFTSQLYFDDAYTDQVHAEPPYAANGQRTTRNSGDGIYGQGGSQLLLAVSPNAGVHTATFAIALQGAVAVEREPWSRVKRRFRSDR